MVTKEKTFYSCYFDGWSISVKSYENYDIFLICNKIVIYGVSTETLFPPKKYLV